MAVLLHRLDPGSAPAGAAACRTTDPMANGQCNHQLVASRHADLAHVRPTDGKQVK